jgi:hypothetical protein
MGLKMLFNDKFLFGFFIMFFTFGTVNTVGFFKFQGLFLSIKSIEVYTYRNLLFYIL